MKHGPHLESGQCFNFNVFRINRLEVFCERGVLKNFTKFTRKHLCQSLIFNQVADRGL